MSPEEHIDYTPFEVEEHFSGVFCEAAGWESEYRGVHTVVALRGGD